VDLENQKRRQLLKRRGKNGEKGKVPFQKVSSPLKKKYVFWRVIKSNLQKVFWSATGDLEKMGCREDRGEASSWITGGQKTRSLK